jgi:O-antigen/teichoic acid export membrane protein
MIDQLKTHLLRYSKSDFLKNVVKLLTGTAFSQVITLAATPILYRIYAKEDFGIIALYLSISAIICSFSSLQYTQAVLLEQKDEDAFQILWLIKFANLASSIVTLLIILLVGQQIAVYLNSPTLFPWLILLPISIFASSQTEVLRTWANRQKQYGVMSWSAILTSILVSGIPITVGLYHKGPLGLFIGVLASQVVPSFYLWYILSPYRIFGANKVNISKIKELAGKYIGMPKYILPSVMINQINGQLPLLILSAFGGPVIVAVYSLSVRILGLPSQLMSNAVGEVFKQRAQEHYIRSGNFRSTFIKTFKMLLGLSIMPFLLIVLLGPHLFTLVFGEKWRAAGVYSQIMSVMFLFGFIISPLTYAYYIKGKQREDLCLHIVLLLGTILTLYYGLVTTKSTPLALLMYSTSYAIIYTIYLIRSYKFSSD